MSPAGAFSPAGLVLVRTRPTVPVTDGLKR
ncbi:hypothetical protein GA0115237_110166, partial [Streptomyces sp. ScaeMP-6W]